MRSSILGDGGRAKEAQTECSSWNVADACRMVINTGSVSGYNNQLRQATPNMKLGVNNSVNLETKKVGVRLMDGGPSKIDRPTSHPSNPIHKAETSNPIHKHQKTFQPPQAKLQKTKSEGNHEILKAGVFIGAAISAFAVSRMF